MVTTNIKSKKIVLMKVTDIMNSPDAKFNLTELLKKAWVSKVNGKTFSDDVDLREMCLPNRDSILMNTGSMSDDSFVGEIVSFEPNGYLVVANYDKTKDKSKLRLKQIETDENDSPYKGITYFLAYNNYVMFLDGGVRYQTVGRYLSWMIGTTFNITKGVHIEINPEIQVEGNQATLVDATELEIRPEPISPTTPIEGYLEELNETEEVNEKSTTAKILDVLNFAYSGFQHYRNETDGNGVVEVQVKIKLKYKNRLFPVSRNLEISEIMKANQDAEFILVGKGGKTKGRFIRANFLADIDYTGSLMKRDSVSTAFKVAFDDFVERGCIK